MGDDKKLEKKGLFSKLFGKKQDISKEPELPKVCFSDSDEVPLPPPPPLSKSKSKSPELDKSKAKEEQKKPGKEPEKELKKEPNKEPEKEAIEPVKIEVPVPKKPKAIKTPPVKKPSKASPSHEFKSRASSIEQKMKEFKNKTNSLDKLEKKLKEKEKTLAQEEKRLKKAYESLSKDEDKLNKKVLDTEKDVQKSEEELKRFESKVEEARAMIKEGKRYNLLLDKLRLKERTLIANQNKLLRKEEMINNHFRDLNNEVSKFQDVKITKLKQLEEKEKSLKLLESKLKFVEQNTGESEQVSTVYDAADDPKYVKFEAAVRVKLLQKYPDIDDAEMSKRVSALWSRYNRGM